MPSISERKKVKIRKVPKTSLKIAIPKVDLGFQDVFVKVDKQENNRVSFQVK